MLGKLRQRAPTALGQGGRILGCPGSSSPLNASWDLSSHAQAPKFHDSLRQEGPLDSERAGLNSVFFIKWCCPCLLHRCCREGPGRQSCKAPHWPSLEHPGCKSPETSVCKVPEPRAAILSPLPSGTPHRCLSWGPKWEPRKRRVCGQCKRQAGASVGHLRPILQVTGRETQGPGPSWAPQGPALRPDPC